MKKNLLLMMLPILVVSMFMFSCNKDDDKDDTVTPEGSVVELSEDSYTEDGYFDGSLYYRIISESKKTAAVAKASASAKHVDIPAQIVLKGKKYTVIEIDEYAFSVGPKDEHGLSTGVVESVQFPNTIRKSSLRAFFGCEKLKKTVAIDLVSWCKIDFDYSSNPLTYHSALYLKSGEKVTKLVIPESITTIKPFAFQGAGGLTEVILHDKVKEVGKDAFSLCKELKSVTFGTGLKTIGEFTFFACSSLGDIVIQDNVVSIGKDAFSDCSSTKSIIMGSGVTKIEERTFFGCRNLKNFSIGKNVKEIDYEGIRLCDNLESVELPDRVATLGHGAFTDCFKLKSITLPNSMRYFGSKVFDGCTSLNVVNSRIKDPSKVSFFETSEKFPHISTITLNVPIGTKDAYTGLSPWNSFKIIVEKEGL